MLLSCFQASLAALVGTSSCMAYLVLLCRSVDAVGPGTKLYMKEAEKVSSAIPWPVVPCESQEQSQSVALVAGDILPEISCFAMESMPL